METTKAGWKSTEFWTTGASAIFGFLAVIGVFSQDDANAMVGAVTQVAGALMAAIPAATYSLSRAKVKGENLKASELVKVLGNTLNK